ncbi:MAG TPA: hypothetical protein DDZ89_02025 [Clostridiales bacterium]|nr:hypothetical protein [Clostridiales bacterium]
MRTSLFIFPGKSQSYYNVIDDAVKTGFDAIELYRACELITPDMEKAKRIGTYAAEKGLSISCISIGANLIQEDNSEEINRLKSYVDVAKAVGTTVLHHTLGSVMKHCNMGISFEIAISHIVDSLIQLCDYAQERDITIVNENQGFLTNGVEFFEELTGRLNYANYGLVADVGNIFFVDQRPESFIGRFAPRIKHVHVKDYLYKPGGGLYPGEEWMMTREGNYLYNTVIGYGVIEFPKIFHILKQSGYTGYFSMECGINEALPQNLAKGLRNMKRYYEIC